jgi:hypothetical protein
VASETDLLTKGEALFGSNLLVGASPLRRISGVRALLDKAEKLPEKI